MSLRAFVIALAASAALGGTAFAQSPTGSDQQPSCSCPGHQGQAGMGMGANTGAGMGMGGNANTTRSELRVLGTLAVSGTASSRVLFDANGASSPAWAGVFLLPTAGASLLDYLTIREADTGLTSTAPSPARGGSKSLGETSAGRSPSWRNSLISAVSKSM